jgi:hypothetical protein
METDLDRISEFSEFRRGNHLKSVQMRLMLSIGGTLANARERGTGVSIVK